MSLLRRASFLVLVITKYSLAVFWGTIVSFYMVYSVLRRPFHSLKRVDRKTPPAVLRLNDAAAAAAASGWTHHRVFLPDRDVTLHYVAGGPVDGPVLLFVHGFPEFWFSWRHQMRAFAGAFRVVAVDTRGYGDSDRPDSVSAYAIGELVQDMRALIHHLSGGRDDDDDRKVHVCAHDWGGAIAWALVAKYPDVVDKLVVLNCPHPAAMLKFMATNPRQLLMSWYMFFFQLPVLPELFCRLGDWEILETLFRSATYGCRSAGAISEEEMEAWKYTFARSGFTAPINYYRANVGKTRPAASSASSSQTAREKAKIANPVLIIWGTEDGFLHKSLAQLSVKLVENGSLKYIEGASHWVQQDRPSEVNEYMKEFLAN